MPSLPFGNAPQPDRWLISDRQQPNMFMQELKHLARYHKVQQFGMATRGRIGYDEHEQILQWMKPKQHGSLPAQG
jgi:hypothetical protein